MIPGWLEADWPAPPGIRAGTTLRHGGVSMGHYASLNLATHVGDRLASVLQNRQNLTAALQLPSEPCWLQQVHGTAVVRASGASGQPAVADAAHTSESGVVCVVMTADCLPVLLCSAQGRSVAALHAGWRGLVGGIIETTVAGMDAAPTLAWLGPALGTQAFEVGDEVRDAFLVRSPTHAAGFRPGRVSGKWQADLYGLARQILQAQGITAIHGGHHCTASEPDRFFSYRRDGSVTGRMASLIWREGLPL